MIRRNARGRLGGVVRFSSDGMPNSADQPSPDLVLEHRVSAEPSRSRGRGRPSMVDVAALAGVSPITVSRVANGSSAVQEETRERVLAAMAEVGYQPNM